MHIGSSEESLMAKQMSTRPNITILSRHMVKPTGEQEHEGPLYMTVWDQLFGMVHNQTVLLYPSSPDLEWAVETLLGSLGRALARFSPLGGRIRWANKELGRMEICCNGEGAEVVAAKCDAEMSSFRGHADPERVMLLAPEVDYKRPLEEQPLLLVRVTRFCCGGVALGLSSAHMAADGEADIHFFSEWARLARGEQIKEAPSLLYRTMFRERERNNNGAARRLLDLSDHIEFQDLPSILPSSREDNGVEEWNKETVKLVLPITKAQLDALKDAASLHDNTISTKFSRYEVVTSHIWRCVCKARRHDSEQETVLSFPMNIRKQIHSIELPKAMFGNMVITMRAKSRAGELISNSLGYTCAKLRDAINKVDEDYIWSNFELLQKQDDLSHYMKDAGVGSPNSEAKTYNGNPNLKVTSWLSLPIPDMDFGWGNMIQIIPLVRDIDGSTILLPSPDNDGSIVVLLTLQVGHVSDFKTHFYQDIN